MKFASLASLEDRSRRSSFFFSADRFLRSSFFLLAALLAGAAGTPSPATAQAQPAPAACSAVAFHAFDFWIGDWDVYDPANGQLSAHARITPVENGCALREEYRALDGSGGESLSAWDVAQHQWRQHWVSSRGAIVSLAGVLSGSSMILTGPETGTHSPPDLIRGTWTPEPAGVREIGERSTDGGHTWKPWFDLHFRRAGSGRPYP
jgi:hypothetical protein